MRVTRRFWAVASVGIALAGWGSLTASPSLLVGAGILGAWLLSVQFSFLDAAQEARADLDVSLEVDEDRLTAEESTVATLAASVDEPTAVSMSVTAMAPAGVEGTIDTVVLDTPSQARRRADLHWPVAGEFVFETPQVTFCDRFGLFTQAISHGDSPTVVVEPRAPRHVHVGKGGDEIGAGFGEHETGRTGSGLKPAEVREYVPGDAVREIDWKATARLDEAHVREFEVQTDRKTKLFVDHRQSMGVGPAGETKLAYARQVVLAVLASARAQGDPVGCCTIGDDGLTATHDPSTTDVGANEIRDDILQLTSTAPADDETAAFSPAVARRRAQALDADASSFAATLRPYVTDQTQYVRRVQSKPLFTALNLYQPGRSRTSWSVLVTDDTNRTELRESIKLARQLDAHVTVFVTPTVLFEPGALEDVEAAYERYADFESFRHELDSLHGVSAFEIGPADRLSAVLSGRQPSTQEARR